MANPLSDKDRARRGLGAKPTKANSMETGRGITINKSIRLQR